MAINNLHKLDRIVAPAWSFEEISSQNWNANISEILIRPAGHPHPMFRGTENQKPAIQFSTPQLSTLLTNIPVGGAKTTSTTSTYFKKAAETGIGNVARATLDHQRINIAEALWHWTSITLPHNGVGEAQVVMTTIYDGVNLPFVHAGSVALAGNVTADEVFGAGPWTINGSSVPAVQEVQIDSGIQLLTEGGESEEFDTFVGIEQTDPVITLKTREMVNWGTFGLRGTQLTSLAGYGRKVVPNLSGGISRVANGTAQHLKFTATAGTVTPVDSNGQTTSAITDTVRIACAAPDDSTLPLIVSGASAIT